MMAVYIHSFIGKLLTYVKLKQLKQMEQCFKHKLLNIFVEKVKYESVKKVECKTFHTSNKLMSASNMICLAKELNAK